MFVTVPQHASKMPLHMLEPDELWWRVVHLAFQLPWFIVTLTEGCGDDAYQHSVCVASELDLMGALRGPDSTTVVSLLGMFPGGSTPGHWDPRDIRTIWEVPDLQGAKRMVFRDSSGREFAGVGDLQLESSDRFLLFNRDH
jgi:hypothetical protein